MLKTIVLLGVPREKIALGLPTFGYVFELVDGNLNGVGSPARGGPLRVAYTDICKLLKSVNFVRVSQRSSRSTYYYSVERKQWISSDTVDDVALKVSGTFVHRASVTDESFSFSGTLCSG